MTLKQNYYLVAYATLAILMLLLATVTETKSIQKRSFAQLGCMGNFDKAIFARLVRTCEECYNVYRDPFIHQECRSNCFKNSMFNDCLKVLLMQSEKENMIKMVDVLYGK
ncbi:crustacean hyperglycemic hormone-like [Limulus polyphemus]|uniref:Crustacean hyperglycemic hormone-like n=1 Tax=Limulus polyphemus TaxID=6850 RepID=A0ABM1S609_LIMPO|nr:crustacean hyperglycemic hormone-like [Limulus polyphemus]